MLISSTLPLLYINVTPIHEIKLAVPQYSSPPRQYVALVSRQARWAAPTAATQYEAHFAKQAKGGANDSSKSSF